VAAQSFGSSAADGNGSSPPYYHCARGAFLNWG
jgi:hypothetical protein